jgi:hypothetical protein
MGTTRNAQNILVGKPEWKKPLVRPRCEWKDNIKAGLARYWAKACVLDSSGLGLSNGLFLSGLRERKMCWIVRCIFNAHMSRTYYSFI